MTYSLSKSISYKSFGSNIREPKNETEYFYFLLKSIEHMDNKISQNPSKMELHTL